MYKNKAAFRSDMANRYHAAQTRLDPEHVWVAANSRDPACDTTPRHRWLRDRRSGRCSLHLESAPLPVDLRLQQSQFPLVAGHFRLSGHGPADQLMKSPG